MPGIRVLEHVTLKITLEEPYFVLMAQLVALCSCFLVGEERRVIQGGGRGAGWEERWEGRKDGGRGKGEGERGKAMWKHVHVCV